MLGFKRKQPEARSVENPEIPISNRAILEYFGLDSMTESGITVNISTALSVPAVLAAVEFLSSTIASLPLNVYKKTDTGREKQSSGLQRVVHDAFTEEMTSFDARKYSMERVLTGGRGLIYIERLGDRIVNLFPLDSSKVTIKRNGYSKTYVYDDGSQNKKTYKAGDIIDVPFALDADGLSSISPIMKCADTIGLSIAATSYGSKFFNNGGVPPFVIQGKFESGKSLQRASDDLQQAIQKAAKERKIALALPLNHELKPIGVDPEKSQLVELKRFQIEEIARIYSLPPVFLQDLTHGTFSNTEQQDLHLVKHTLRRWITQIEQEMNLKLFGRDESNTYVEFNIDGLLRGDFTTRMEGHAKAIQNAIRTPDEVRAMENLPAKGATADELHIQGATVPLGTQNNAAQPTQESEKDE